MRPVTGSISVGVVPHWVSPVCSTFHCIPVFTARAPATISSFALRAIG